jgi:hypothetical protein
MLNTHRGSFPEIKRPELEADQSHLLPKLRINEDYFCYTYMPSWGGGGYFLSC